jgi:phosphatidylglycerophosphate synthase
MLDRALTALIRRPLVALARGLVRLVAGLALLLASRLMDGLDGAVARLTAPTDRGAFLDITLDFLFYASIPLAFALADPAANAWRPRCCWRPSSAPAVQLSWRLPCWPSAAG